MHDILKRLGIDQDPRVVAASAADGVVLTHSPATGEAIAGVKLESTADYEALVQRCQAVQREWQMLPAPKRGEIVRRIGNAFRDHD